MLYTKGQDFHTKQEESRKRHLPLYLTLDVIVDDESPYYNKGPLKLCVTAGELNRCKKLGVDNSLVKRMGAGHVYRVTDASNGHANPRMVMKLWLQPTKGYITRRRNKYELCSEEVFSVPEDIFLGWIVP